VVLGLCVPDVIHLSQNADEVAGGVGGGGVPGVQVHHKALPHQPG